MQSFALAPDAGEAEFREAARRALQWGLAPSDVFFSAQSASLFDAPKQEEIALPSPVRVPRAFAELMQAVICHRATDRFALLYECLWRLAHKEPGLLEQRADPLMARLFLYAKSVGRDVHKMHAFVRFRETQTENGPFFTAWFEPEHYILERATPFFAKRFASMRWVIATPIGTVTWDGKERRIGPAIPKPVLVEDAALDDLWATYYRTIFNPARVNMQATTKEMARRYWPNLPEAAYIPAMIEGAQKRLIAMDREADAHPRYATAAAPRKAALPAVTMPWDDMRTAASACTRCPLHAPATQTVLGEGPRDAPIMLVGEQPGDVEDVMGRPFAGAAGQVLDRALKEAGLPREKLYITNAVKHFKYEPRGKRRLHKRPDAGEIQHCRFWLLQELELVRPNLVVALGATAAHALAGKAVPLNTLRGADLEWPGGWAGMATVHPAYLLRLEDARAAKEEYARFVEDLARASMRVNERSAA